MRYNRKKFINAFTAGTVGGLLMNSMSPFSSNAQPGSPTVADDNGEFLFTPGMIYLNTGTLGPCRKETLEASMKAWEDLESIPLRFYGKWGAEPFAEKTRTIAARFLGCDLDEIMMTTSTTNGMNAIAQGLRLQPGDHIIATDQEHGGGILSWHYYEKYHGVKLDIVTIPPNEHSAESILNMINDAITPKTRAISISHVFSSTGLRTPIDKVSALARAKNILCIVDGAQAAGAIKVNMAELGCHAYATSGHKWLMGPKGTGLLYIAKEAQDRVRPMQFEESHNTYSEGSGVVNLATIIGLGKAIEYLESIGIGKIEEHNLALRNQLYKKLSAVKNLTLACPPPGSLASPMLACIVSEKIERTKFVRMLLDKHNLCIRPTHKQWFNGIRFCMHVFNTQQEVDRAAEIVLGELNV